MAQSLGIFVKMRIPKNTYFLLVLCITGILPAQDSADYFGKKPFEYDDEVYRENIRTVILHPFNDPTGFPVLELNNPDSKLQLGFDELKGKEADYYYTVVHCTHDWKPSALLPTEYIDGFFDEQIFNVSFSRNTIHSYIHYEQIIPSSSLRITKTGNYIVKVFPEGDPDHPILSKRFLVIKDRVWCNAAVTQSTEVQGRWEKQELNFEIDYSSLKVMNPSTELRVVILKNRNWNKALTDPSPFSNLDRKLSYQLNEQLRFAGGKEFRYFNTNSLTFKNEFVSDIHTDSSGTHFDLYPLKPLNKTKYLEYEDLNGGFMPDLAYSKQPEREADYVFVNISLVTPPIVEKGNVYVFGQFSDWECEPEYKMHYDESSGAYRARLFLKQGYYNYRFAFLPGGIEVPDEEKIDGSSFEAENEYLILVYHSPPGGNFEQLVGFRRLRAFY